MNFILRAYAVVAMISAALLGTFALVQAATLGMKALSAGSAPPLWPMGLMLVAVAIAFTSRLAFEKAATEDEAADAMGLQRRLIDRLVGGLFGRAR